MACELDLTLGIGFEAGELDPSWNQAGKPLLKNRSQDTTMAT